MAGFDRSILTDVGWDALGDAEAGQHIEYTHLEAGDGFVYGGDAEIFAMTNLVHKVMNFPITNFTNDGQGQITLIGVISSQNVTTGFQFREIGVRCTIDGGPSILYAVSNAGDDADYMPSSGESGVVIQTVQIIIKIDRAENVSIVVQPGLDVTCQNIGAATVGPGWFRDKQGQICWFKRINSPKGTLELSETTELVSIDIPSITIDLDMWVALGNPDIFPHFSTIQKALDYLFPLTIKPGIFVTIHVAAGVWLNSAPILINHVQGQQVKIIGEASAAKTVTSCQSLGTNTVRLNAAAGTFSGMVVGDYIYYANTASAPSMAVSGAWPITAVAGNGSTVTYTTTLWGTWPLTTVTGGTAYHLKTVVSFASGGNGMTVKGDGLGMLKNCILRGNVSGTIQMHGFQVIVGEAWIEYVGAYGWLGTSGSNGIITNGTGRLHCTNCSANNGEHGFSSGDQGAWMSANTCFANGNNRIGFSCQGGDFSGSLCVACGNKTIGFVNTDVGSISLNNSYGSYNAQYGLYCQFHSNIGIGPFAGGSYLSNTTRDVQITSLSSIIRTGPAMSYGSANIAPNTLSWDGCLFSP